MLKSAISSSIRKNRKKSIFGILTVGSCTRLLGEHVQKFQKSWPHGLWDYNVWSGKKSFFACAQQGQQTLTARGAKFLNYGTLSFCTIVMHIMLGTCVPNLRGRWWVEHTKMHPALKKGTKKFHNTSKSSGIFSDLIFSWNKNPNRKYEGPSVF
jgi:hypothetical protein